MRSPLLTRRQLLLLAGTAACVEAADKDFWNSKPPSEWEIGEIYTLMNNSPWAKTVSWQGPLTLSEHSRGVQEGNMRLVGPKAVVTWESAPPIRDALKTPSVPLDADFYVIGVDTIPNADEYDYLEMYAHLRCDGKSKWNLKAFAMHELIRNSMVYQFTFPRSAAPIGPDTGEVIFEIASGTWMIQSRFKPKEMLYHGQLAL
jgi:hypothetical protein